MATSVMPESRLSTTLTACKLQLDLSPLTYERYWRFGLLPSKLDYQFCKDQNTAPVRVSEFSEASRSFPIVFMNDKHHMPHVALGLAPQINLALTHKYTWRNGLYLPKELQVYPFGLLNTNEDDEDEDLFADSLPIPHEENEPTKFRSLLAIDATSPMVVSIQSEPDATPLFNLDGSVTTIVTQTIATQTNIKRDQTKTESFISAIRANRLLTDKTFKLHFKDDTLLTVSGFSVISKTAFNQLSPTVIERWKELGYIDYIEQHWASLKKWTRLILLHERRMTRDLNALRLKRKSS